MLDGIPKEKVIVGVKQTKKALKEKQALKVIIADDAQNHVVDPIIEVCNNDGVIVEHIDSMEKLGKAVKIDVGAAVVTILK